MYLGMSESIGVCLYIQSDRDERYILMIKEISMEVLRDQPSEGANKNSSTTTSSLARNDNNVPTTQQENPVESNLQTLLEFKKMLQKEQQDGESKVQAINEKIDLTKKEIDGQRIILEDLRLNLKKINEAKDAEYPKFLELKNNLMELRNKMKTLDEKKGNLPYIVMWVGAAHLPNIERHQFYDDAKRRLTVKKKY